MGVSQSSREAYTAVAVCTVLTEPVGLKRVLRVTPCVRECNVVFFNQSKVTSTIDIIKDKKTNKQTHNNHREKKRTIAMKEAKYPPAT